MTSGQAHVPQWSREAMTATPYQVTYDTAPANYPAIPDVAPAPVTPQYAPQQYQVATYGNQAPLVPYPNQNLAPAQAPNVLAQPDKTGNKALRYIAIGAASLAAVSAIGVGLMFKGVNDTIKSTPNDGADRNTSAPANTYTDPGAPLDVYGTDIRDKDYSRQLDVILPILQEQRSKSASTFYDGELQDPNTFTGDKKWAQEVFNNFSYDIRTASLQDNKTLSENLLSGVFAPTAAPKNMTDQIEEGVGSLLSRDLVDAVSKEYNSGYIQLGTRQIKIDSATRLVNVIDMNTSTAWNVYVSEQHSANGKYSAPVIVASIKYGNSDFVSDIENWQPQA